MRFIVVVSVVPMAIALSGCPPVHDQCVTSVGRIRPPISSDAMAAAVTRCENDLDARTFLECAPADWQWTSYDQILKCLDQAHVSLIRPSPVSLGTATSSTPGASPSSAPIVLPTCFGPGPTPPPAMVAATSYRPSIHGFRFLNSCPSPPSNYLCCHVSPGVEGCCEGMSYGSLDYYRRGLEVPLIAWPAAALDEWNALDAWIIARQREAGWKNRPEFLAITNNDPLYKSNTTKVNWPIIKSTIDGGEPILIALAPDSPWVWEAHAVVAWAYAEAGGHKWLWIYENQVAGDDGVWLEWSETNPLQIYEYQTYRHTCGINAWTAIAAVDYFGPGTLANSSVPSVFTRSQIQGTDGAIVQRASVYSGLFAQPALIRGLVRHRERQ
jgi:hypothetical protein